MKYFFLFLLSLTLFLCSCEHKKGDFFVKAPQGWVTIDSIEKGKKSVFMRLPIYDSMPIFVNNINISIIPYRNVDRYMELLMEEVSKTARLYKEKSKGVLKTKNFTAKWIQYYLIAADSLDEYEQKVYFIGDSGNIYMIVCTSEKDNLTKMQKEIDEVINSFKIL